MPRTATTGRFPVKSNLINGMFFDGVAGIGSVAMPADAQVAVKTVRVILTPQRVYSSTVGVFGGNTANWYLAYAGSSYRYSYFNAAGTQLIGSSSAGSVVANVPQEIVMVHSNDGVPGGSVFIDFYKNGVFLNRVTNAGGDGGGVYATVLTLGSVVGIRAASAVYLAEIYDSTLSAQDIADLWINKAISATPIHQYLPNASASTISDTGSGTSSPLACTSTFLTNDAPFKARTAAAGRTFIRGFEGGVTNKGVANNYASATAPASVKVATKTIRVVTRPYANPSGIQGIFSLATSNYYCGVTSNRNTFFSYANNAGSQRTSSSGNNTIPIPGQVTELVFTMNLTGSVTTGDVTVGHYINGAFVSNSTVTGEGVAAAYGTSMVVGAVATTNSYNGAIYAYEIYDRILTADEIGSLALVQKGSDIGLAPIEGSYFPNGSGSTVTGLVTNLTMVNNMEWVFDYPSDRIPVA